ncbi:hypothetical protein LPJ63_002971 [Coemansia sp. RSA 2711]|nr:hypothetical protein LPJ63_002971 [Coemansia sp. RSA 2711]
MGSPPVFEIRFPAYTSGGPPRCSPKSTLTGVVYLHISKAMQASCLSLSLMGSERVLLAPESVNSARAPNVSASTAKQRVLKKVYFNQSTVLWGDSKLRALDTLPAGIHMFHFSCEFPRVNYPQSRTTPEYEIKYALKAKLLNPRDARECTVLSTSQPVAYVPETVAPPQPVSCDAMARYAFCDNVVEGQQTAYHLRATGLQQAFRPGDAVDLQLRLTGQRALRRLQFAVVEQTDCFYPQIPEPREELLDMGRRLWSTQRVLSAPADLPYERDSYVTPDLCPDHMTSKRARGGTAYYAHLHTRLPADALVLPETGYLRFTYFVELTLSAGAAAWGSQPRSTQVRIPIPVATRVLPEDATAGSHPGRAPASATREPPAAITANRGSGAEADSLDIPDCARGPAPPKPGRSIADLGARLQQFIPRRVPSAAHARHAGLHGRAGSHQPHAGRAVSHGRIGDHQPLWSMADMPPMPPVPPAMLGVHADANASQASLFNSPLIRAASLSTSDGDASHMRVQSHSALQNQLASSSAIGDHGSRFSLTFLLRLRDFNHHEAGSAALASYVGGQDADSDSIVPSAVRRAPAAAASGDPPPGISRLGLGARRSGHRSRDFSLGIASSSSSSASLCLSSRRGSRASIQSVSSAVTTCERVQPRLEPVMTSFRDPATSHVATWSALSPGRPESTQCPATPAKEQSSRYSRLSAMSVSSNDTACASSACLSLSKDLPPPIPTLHTRRV